MAEKYRCSDCGWQGTEKELEYDQVESCMGDMDIEICPKCGSMDLKKMQNQD